jgi:plastocyanin
LRIAPVLSVGLTVAALSATGLAAAGIVNVTQKNRAFGIPSVQIQTGGLVDFNNEDTFRHQIYVESPSFTFESDEQDPGKTVEIKFSKAGLFEVRCHIHPKMLLKVDAQ